MPLNGRRMRIWVVCPGVRVSGLVLPPPRMPRLLSNKIPLDGVWMGNKCGALFPGATSLILESLFEVFDSALLVKWTPRMVQAVHADPAPPCVAENAFFVLDHLHDKECAHPPH